MLDGPGRIKTDTFIKWEFNGKKRKITRDVIKSGSGINREVNYWVYMFGRGGVFITILLLMWGMKGSFDGRYGAEIVAARITPTVTQEGVIDLGYAQITITTPTPEPVFTELEIIVKTATSTATGTGLPVATEIKVVTPSQTNTAVYDPTEPPYIPPGSYNPTATPYPTFTKVPTIIPSPTFTSSPTITLSPTITSSPTVTLSPSPSPTWYPVVYSFHVYLPLVGR